MKNIGKLALLGAALAVSASSAFATTISGSIGASSFNGSFNGSSLTFGATGIVTALAGASFTPYYSDGNAVTFSTNPLAYAAAGGSITVPGSTATTNGIFAAQIIENGETLDFYVTSESTLLDTTSSYLDLSGTGYFTETGGTAYTATAAGFSLTGSSTGNAVFNIGGTATAPLTPEPSSLMLLGTGLVSGAGMLMRRRKIA